MASGRVPNTTMTFFIQKHIQSVCGAKTYNLTMQTDTHCIIEDLSRSMNAHILRPTFCAVFPYRHLFR